MKDHLPSSSSAKGKLSKASKSFRVRSSRFSNQRSSKLSLYDVVCFGHPIGWDLGILGGLEGEITPMNVGGRRRLSVPAGLAYGSDQVGPIPPNQDLDFELEVVQAGKESDISLPFRLGGYAVALGVPLLILLLAFNLLGK